jgi:hypothetical protein
VRRATHERFGDARPPKPAALVRAHAIALALLFGLWSAPRERIPRYSTRTRTRCSPARRADVRLAEPGPRSTAHRHRDDAARRARGERSRGSRRSACVRIAFWPSVALVR